MPFIGLQSIQGRVKATGKPLGVMTAGRWYPDETLAELIKISKPTQ
jgi:hypothetical protein